MSTGYKMEYLHHIAERIRLQQEVRDRWFKYYLSIAGTIFGIALALTKLMHSRHFSIQLYTILLVLCLIMYLIGLCFLMIYINQRKNYLRFYKLMNFVEESMMHDLRFLENDQITAKAVNELLAHPKGRRFGADFFTIWVHIVINSLYIAFAMLFTQFIVKKKTILAWNNLCPAVIVFLLSAAILEFVRGRLFKHDLLQY